MQRERKVEKDRKEGAKVYKIIKLREAWTYRFENMKFL